MTLFLTVSNPELTLYPSTMGVATLVIVFGLKPQSPVFSLETLTLDLYELNSYLNSTLFVSSVITLTLNSQNPNKLGIRYSPSRLRVYFEGMPVGTIRVPGFLQPSHSYNVTVPTRVLFQCVNVSHVLAEASHENTIQMKILGDVKAQLVAFHIITLLKIKVSLECDINIDPKQLSIKNEVYSAVKNHMDAFQASFPANPQTIFRKCALAFYI
ncbi:hypothetical protein L484_002476 [Morus notabilis]|uniref:Late embryogenesis abundant protein LEA-2 subgroup domain-containing protein n=1 Tax=Morus notabilis TaxID=981085 RepID=W9QTR0_9ROSA|nr:hypothetical protein L484_002476 [Morus notabilis]